MNEHAPKLPAATPTPEQRQWDARKRPETVLQADSLPERHSAEIIPLDKHRPGVEIVEDRGAGVNSDSDGVGSLREIGLREIATRFSPNQDAALSSLSLTPNLGESNKDEEPGSWFGSAGRAVGSYFGVLGHNEVQKDEKLMEDFGKSLVSFEDKLHTVEGIMGKFSSDVDFTLLNVKLTEWRDDFSKSMRELEKIEEAKVPGDLLLKEEREWIHESAKQVAVSLNELDTFTNELKVALKIKSN